MAAGPSGDSGDPSGTNNTNTNNSWERAWTTEEMKRECGNWSLAGDAGLLLYLQQFSAQLMAKTHEIEKSVHELSRESRATDCRLHNTMNDFVMAANNQFVESRVYEDVVDEDASPDAATTATTATTTITTTTPETSDNQASESELVPKVAAAIAEGVKILKTRPRNDVATSASAGAAVSGATSASAGSAVSGATSASAGSAVSGATSASAIRSSLPAFVGSTRFFEDDFVGLLPAETVEADETADILVNDANDVVNYDRDAAFEGEETRQPTIKVDDDYDDDDDDDMFSAPTTSKSLRRESEVRSRGLTMVEDDEDPFGPPVLDRRSSMAAMAAEASLPKGRDKKAMFSIFGDDDDDDDDEEEKRGRGGGTQSLFDDDDEEEKGRKEEEEEEEDEEDGSLFGGRTEEKKPDSKESSGDFDVTENKQDQEEDENRSSVTKAPPPKLDFAAELAIKLGGGRAQIPTKSVTDAASKKTPDNDDDAAAKINAETTTKSKSPDDVSKKNAPPTSKPAPRKLSALFSAGDDEDDDDDNDMFHPAPTKKSGPSWVPAPAKLGAGSLFDDDDDDEDDGFFSQPQKTASVQPSPREPNYPPTTTAPSKNEASSLTAAPLAKNPAPQKSSLFGDEDDDDDDDFFVKAAPTAIDKSKPADSKLNLFDDNDDDDDKILPSAALTPAFSATPRNDDNDRGRSMTQAAEEASTNNQLASKKPKLPAGAVSMFCGAAITPIFTKQKPPESDDEDEKGWSSDDNNENGLFGDNNKAPTPSSIVAPAAPATSASATATAPAISAFTAASTATLPAPIAAPVTANRSKPSETASKLPAGSLFDEEDDGDFTAAAASAPVKPAITTNVTSLFDDDDDEEEEDMFAAPKNPKLPSIPPSVNKLPSTPSLGVALPDATTSVSETDEITTKNDDDDDDATNTTNPVQKPSWRPPAGAVALFPPGAVPGVALAPTDASAQAAAAAAAKSGPPKSAKISALAQGLNIPAFSPMQPPPGLARKDKEDPVGFDDDDIVEEGAVGGAAAAAPVTPVSGATASSSLLSSATKSRAKIQTKRRPPTRNAKKVTTITASSETPNLPAPKPKSTSPPVVSDIAEPRPEKNAIKSLPSGPLSGDDDDDDLFSVGAPRPSGVVQSVSNAKTDKAKLLASFLDDDDHDVDIFGRTSVATPAVTAAVAVTAAPSKAFTTAVPVIPSAAPPMADLPKSVLAKPSKETTEDDIFGVVEPSTPLTNGIDSSVKPKTNGVISVKGILDDDDDDDLFGVVKAPTKKPEIKTTKAKKSPLMDDDDDDDDPDDIFGDIGSKPTKNNDNYSNKDPAAAGMSKTKTLPKSIMEDPDDIFGDIVSQPVKSTKASAATKEVALEDPDDIFGDLVVPSARNTSKAPVKAASVVKRAPVPTDEDDDIFGVAGSRTTTTTTTKKGSSSTANKGPTSTANKGPTSAANKTTSSVPKAVFGDDDDDVEDIFGTSTTRKSVGAKKKDDILGILDDDDDEDIFANIGGSKKSTTTTTTSSVAAKAPALTKAAKKPPVTAAVPKKNVSIFGDDDDDIFK